MSAVIERAVAALNAKAPGGFDGSARFVFEGEGALLLGPEGARPGDGPAKVTLRAPTEVFLELFEKRLDPMAAYMTGRLKIEGSITEAMKLARIL